MATIKTNGIKIDLSSLRAAAKETKDLDWRLYQTISFDMETGEVIYWCGVKDNWVEYNDPAILKAFNTRSHCSEQHIADEISRAVREARSIYTEIGWEFKYNDIFEQEAQ